MKPRKEGLQVCVWSPHRDQEQHHPAKVGRPILGGAFGGFKVLSTSQVNNTYPTNLNRLDTDTFAPPIPNVPEVLRLIRAQPLQSNPINFNQDEFQQPDGMAELVEAAMKNIRYKTELCKHYKRRGYCPMGIYCQFAHGIEELRCISSHPKYRTEHCIYFERERQCPYGSHCAFTHAYF